MKLIARGDLGKLKMFKKKVVYVVWAALSGWWIFWLTMNIFYGVDGHVLSATIWNMIFIVVFLISDRLFDLLTVKTKAAAKRKNNLFLRALNWYLDSASFKSGIYFFYIGITVCSAIMAADPEFIPLLTEMSDFFLSVRYGILLLIAVDKFMEQIFKDIKKYHKEEAVLEPNK